MTSLVSNDFWYKKTYIFYYLPINNVNFSEAEEQKKAMEILNIIIC